MKSASQMLYEHMGRPAVEDIVEHGEDPCWVCGGDSSIGMPVDAWNGSSFTGQNRIVNPMGQWVCSACVCICARNTPVPGRPPKEGKTFGGNFRNYSHLYDDGEYINASKGEKPAIRAFLAGRHKGPWWAAIADSGQKHVIPWAPINPPACRRGRVLFEETLVEIPRSHEFGLIEQIADLLTAGATKDSITTGIYQPGEWQRCEVALRLFEDRWRYLRASPWWHLSLWLAQRDEDEVAKLLEEEKASKAAKTAKKEGKAKNGKVGRGKSGQAPNVDRGSAPRTEESVPADARIEQPQELGHAPDTDENRNRDQHESRAVDHDDAPKAGSKLCAKREQLQLFR